MLAPIRYDDELIIRARLTELTPIKIGFNYEIAAKADGRLLATGASLNVSINASGKITKLPPTLLDAIRSEI